ncbi:MAG: formylglycine-generating enzyme family protein [Cyclobacteriaceae bacterium]|nr:formylglycine-generating enzyme family protein [Cyclobacteriaceae bacterium]
MIKNTLALLIFLNVYFNCISQEIKFSKRKTTIEYINPPNGVYLYDNVFIDKTEISNLAYLEYLSHIRKDSTESFYNSQLPDSLCYQVKLQPNDSINPFIYHYFRYPGFRFYPVIGVSYEQALNYCKWRGEVVTESFAKGDYHSKFPKLKDFDIIVEYRLPTKEEWELAALGGLNFLDFPYGVDRPIKNKYYSFKIKNSSFLICQNKNSINYKDSDIIHKIEFNVYEDYYLNIVNPVSCKSDTSFSLSYIFDFSSNGYGLYNMIGNVAEMTMTKGLAKGGSFRSKLNDFNIKTDFQYSYPTEWLGFRCVAIMHIRRKNNG